MNLLCPDCHSSVSVDESEPWLSCDSCGLKANLSRIETAPGSASFPMVKDLTGESLGGYELQELIGVGGMGVVYKARSVGGGGVPVAVKVLNCDYHWQREEFVSRFLREAKALSRLDHPNIVTILDSGKVDDQYYLVTEYVDGVNLAQYLRTRELSTEQVVELMTQVCGAITYAHEHGIVHRDIKPANVVVAGGRAKVLDFGLAQITGGTTGLSSLTRTDLAMGTINYLSPEQRTNAKHVDERSDVFSLGVVLYEMLTGRLPLGGFEPASRHRRSLGRRGDRIVSRALEASPERRYQSVAELAGDLRQLVQPRNTGRMAALAAVILAALGLGIGIWTLSGPQDRGRLNVPVKTAQMLQLGKASGNVPGLPGLTDAMESKVARSNTKPVPPASGQADGSDPNKPSPDADKKPVRTRGLPTLVVDSRGRKFPWLGGKGVYRIGKGARPVAIIDHKGQRWPWPKGASVQDVLRIYYAGRKVKGVKRVKRQPVKNVRRSVKGIKGGGKKPWRRRKGFKKEAPWLVKKRLLKRKRAVKGRPAPRMAQPARPARRRAAPFKLGK